MKNEITLSQFIKSYWNYYLELEEQLNQTKRFVDFDISNYKTFSIEYLKLLQATCSEIDVVAKIIAKNLILHFQNSIIRTYKNGGSLFKNILKKFKAKK